MVDVIESEHLALVKCTLKNEATQSGIERNAPDLAAGLGKGEAQLRVECSVEASAVTLRIKSGDPLAEPVASKVAMVDATPATPIRLGRYADGSPATVRLLGGHHLVAGRTGAGKSKAFMLLLIAAVERGAVVHVVDLKWGIEAGPIAPRCASVAKTREAARDLIAEVRSEMERRGQKMAAEGWTDWGQSPDPRPLVLGVDEAAQIKNDEAAWADLLEVVRLGRAAWVVIVLAAQSPTKSSIPSEITSQLGSRWLGPLTQPESVVALRGVEVATAPYQLTETPGRAVLVAGGHGTEIQTDWLRPEAVAAWAAAVPQDVAEATVRRLPKVQAAVLAVVESSPGCTAEDVARALDKDRSQMNRTLKSLARNGLVEATNTKPATWRATNKETP